MKDCSPIGIDVLHMTVLYGNSMDTVCITMIHKIYIYFKSRSVWGRPQSDQSMSWPVLQVKIFQTANIGCCFFVFLGSCVGYMSRSGGEGELCRVEQRFLFLF